ncbi:DUF6197 family protein [Streptomyces sp. NPDC002640]
MSQQKSTPTTITATTVVISDEMLARAAELEEALPAYRSPWTGDSGEQSSGESVARHLEAARALLDKRGWARTWILTSSEIDADDDTLSVKAMVRQLLRVVRDELGASRGPLTLWSALREIRDTSQGDSDTCRAADRVLDVLVQALTGTDLAQATAWSERLHRTHADINALLDAGIVFARTYGPAVESVVRGA